MEKFWDLFLWIRKVFIALPALLLLAAPVRAVDFGPTPGQYITYGSVSELGAYGTDENQMRYSTGMAVKLFPKEQIWNLTGFEFEYRITGTGYTHDDSAPFTMDHNPRILAPFWENDWSRVSAVADHESNGEGGDTSRSRDVAGLEYEFDWLGPVGDENLWVRGKLFAWYLLDEGSGTDFYDDLRTFGGGVGVDASVSVYYGENLVFMGRIRQGLLQRRAGLESNGRAESVVSVSCSTSPAAA